MIEAHYRKKADHQAFLLSKTINALVKDQHTREALNHHMGIMMSYISDANKAKLKAEIKRRNNA